MEDKKTNMNNDQPLEEESNLDEQMVTIAESEYQKLVRDAAESKDKYLRLLAEFENARKRNERERMEFIKYAKEEVLEDFLNILDDLERTMNAAKANHQDYAAFLKGMELVMGNIREVLKRNEVKPIESVGKMFDPALHEALMQEEKEDCKDGEIVEEFQKGYLLGEKVIRFAKVKVAKRK